MAPRLAITALLAFSTVLLALLGAPGSEAKSVDGARGPGLAWLEAQIEAGAGPFAAQFAEAAHANGLDPAAWPTDNPVAAQITVPGAEAPGIQLLRPLHALALANDSRAGLEGNLTQRVLATFDGTQFGALHALNDDAYAILALRAAGLPGDDSRLQASAAFLRSKQHADGGWGWSTQSAPGTDMTGLVLAALDASATDGSVVPLAQQAQQFLATTRDGTGYAETPGGNPNCESTAWALRIQDLADSKPDPGAWRFLLGLQNPDGGFAHLPGGPSDAFCTSEALTVLGMASAGTLPFRLGSGQTIPGSGLGPAALGLATAAVAMSTRIRPV